MRGALASTHLLSCFRIKEQADHVQSDMGRIFDGIPVDTCRDGRESLAIIRQFGSATALTLVQTDNVLERILYRQLQTGLVARR